MDIRLGEVSAIIKKQIADFACVTELVEIGKVVSVEDGIANVYGLDNIQAAEMVEFENGVKGMALSLQKNNVGIVIFGHDSSVQEGDIVKRTGQMVQVPSGMGMLGRVVDALGNPLDDKGPLQDVTYSPAEVKAPGIITRKSVHEPVQTGIKAIDTLIPIGRGQRELIIGDRQVMRRQMIKIKSIVFMSQLVRSAQQLLK
jgi:F-type H+-transporting ATPase subunit alpha